MKKILDPVTKELIHIVFQKNDFKEVRTDISPPTEFLQLSALCLKNNKTFKPHKHIFYEKITTIAQESWVVIQGKVKAILFNLNDEIEEEIILNPGDISITFKGGHTYEILEENTLVYEYKTGPYLGQKFDKVFIEDKRKRHD